MNYTLSTLWHERSRFLPGMVAVAFSATLIYLQFGMLLGLFALTSTPIDHAPAEIWITHPQINSVDLGRAIPLRWQGRLALQPEVTESEAYFLGIVELEKPGKRPRLCTVIGPRLHGDSLGAPRELTPRMREMLSEKGAIVVDAGDLEALGLTGVGDVADVFGHRVRVVDVFPKGTLRSLAMPYVVCSMDTAELLFGRLPSTQTMFILGKCCHPGDAAKVVDRLKKEYKDSKDGMGVFTSDQFRERTRVHWLTTSRGGIAAGYGAGLALLVGGMIIYQTLYAATMASKREYAVLDALGITRWRMAAAVFFQSFWVGIGGIALALPTTFGLSWLADHLNAQMLLPLPLLVGASAVTMAITLLSGLLALRALQRIEPTQLLR